MKTDTTAGPMDLPVMRLVERMRGFEVDHKPDGWPAIRMRDVTALCYEIEGLILAEEGAKEAFGHVVQAKRELEAECTRLRELLQSAYEDIRRAARHNAVMRGGKAIPLD
ncbi:MAG: hypothetical protein GZ093_20610 [Rhodoferax sp.]|uniref:hypothetical protein n=1 Tax=Rhodoferax sp. TaxID=50421 RepID=UPI0013FEAABB|nr:hypothetical protein [Rhodoferax sp.]NDP41084.1 hypothetical protein [Rhodoferax sp.]